MKRILITAYAVNPYKGSEDGTGWNWIMEAGKNNAVVAVTRKNNKTAIDSYFQANPSLGANVEWRYFDFPTWMIWWKKGPLLSVIYFYLWQIGVACLMWNERKKIDIVHSLNFHSSWTPSFLWMLGKPMIWGPIGHHPAIPNRFLARYGMKSILQDTILWSVKHLFWYLDPWVYLCKWRANKIIVVNDQVALKLRLPSEKTIFMPAVAANIPLTAKFSESTKKNTFQIVSAGRFVALKDFALIIDAFHLFYQSLSGDDQRKIRFTIIGSGPLRSQIDRQIERLQLQHCITIEPWLPQAKVHQRMQKADVFLFGSHEGAGMVVAEAMSFGLPTVVLRNWGPGAYVPPTSNLKIETGNYQTTITKMAEKLQLLYQYPAYYQHESKLALERFHSLFTWESKGKLLAELYASITVESPEVALNFGKPYG